jgi:hypothetical protein
MIPGTGNTLRIRKKSFTSKRAIFHIPSLHDDAVRKAEEIIPSKS